MNLKSIFEKFTGKKTPLTLVVEPDDRLHQVCEPVTKFDDKLEEFVQEMAHFMFTKLPWGQAAGLAAPQVGKNIRLFLLNEGVGADRRSGDFRLFINPVVVWKTKAPATKCKEGCFSLEAEKMDYEVDRAPSITIRYQHLEGQWLEERYNGKRAQTIQHEIDHLDGILVNQSLKSK